jgi:hypothetical protein
MLYDVDQVANKLNVSKVTIYNKLKLKELKDNVITKAGKKYLDEDLFNLIKDSLKDKNEIKSNNIDEPINQEASVDKEDLLNLNKDLFNTLIEQLKEKDIQIHELNNRLSQEQELTKNMQILQLRQPPQDIKALEEHFKDLDNKLLNIRERMEQKKDQEQKGIFKKLFKK